MNTRINILQWILTKLGTYLVLKRIWNPIDFQGQRSRSPGQIFRWGDTPRFALPLLKFVFCIFVELILILNMHEIFAVAHLATNNELLTLTFILKIIGQYDVKCIMTLPIKTTSVFNVSTNIITIRLYETSDIVCLFLQSCRCSILIHVKVGDMCFLWNPHQFLFLTPKQLYCSSTAQV